MRWLPVGNKFARGDLVSRGKFLEGMNEDEKKQYVEDLAQYIADQRITIEVCLTSNMQTIPTLKKISDHPFGKMLAHKLSVSICTDNRLVSHTTVCKEIELALEAFPVAPDHLKDIIIYGFKRSFMVLPYAKKRDYVRQLIEYYEELEKEFSIVE